MFILGVSPKIDIRVLRSQSSPSEMIITDFCSDYLLPL